jgi:hypothetical protein
LKKARPLDLWVGHAKVEAVILYGIASAVSDDIQDWYLSRKEADATLTATLRDEPDFEGELWVEGGRVRAEPPSRPEPPDAFTYPTRPADRASAEEY